MGRIIAFDYGTKRIGIAVTDPMRIIASPLETVRTIDFFIFLKEYLEKEQVDEFVIGYPRQMNNQPSSSVIQLKPFLAKLKKEFPDKPVHLVDERFTSMIAMNAMIEGGVKKKDRQNKSLVDKISASLILQSFLEKKINR